MHEEVSKVSMLCVVLFALAVIISLGYVVFVSAKGVSDNLVMDTQASLTTITQADLEMYDQNEVSGTEVMDAFYLFQGRPIAILIHNYSMENGLKTNVTEDNDPDTVDPSPYAIEIERVKAGTETIEKIQCLNYNALLVSDEQGTLPKELAKTGVVVADGSQGILTLNKEKGYTANYSFAIDLDEESDDKGQIRKNYGVGGFQAKNTCEYIPSGARYNASLIRFTDGTIMGIVFIQK
ncbi:hypothetical protein SAMN02745136_00469 [Anaerocolumna jejuensis DSM 15929]|uniref:Uncharacterized protein n=1 Tax=Anaerocolumna jejuensis DSM 15929 TaxID=1121322 RepID=A0A1M6KIP3_9FIRM|nr:hypothetical protein [Anaerocolumna jejuensis]SHJ58848.1 hypothetical protein SAMN02745136_00469 [Anaerocolumna jejuensis DSM 15929]